MDLLIYYKESLIYKDIIKKIFNTKHLYLQVTRGLTLGIFLDQYCFKLGYVILFTIKVGKKSGFMYNISCGKLKKN